MPPSCRAPCTAPRPWRVLGLSLTFASTWSRVPPPAQQVGGTSGRLYVLPSGTEGCGGGWGDSSEHAHVRGEDEVQAREESARGQHAWPLGLVTTLPAGGRHGAVGDWDQEGTTTGLKQPAGHRLGSETISQFSLLSSTVKSWYTHRPLRDAPLHSLVLRYQGLGHTAKGHQPVKRGHVFRNVAQERRPRRRSKARFSVFGRPAAGRVVGRPCCGHPAHATTALPRPGLPGPPSPTSSGPADADTCTCPWTCTRTRTRRPAGRATGWPGGTPGTALTKCAVTVPIPALFSGFSLRKALHPLAPPGLHRSRAQCPGPMDRGRPPPAGTFTAPSTAALSVPPRPGVTGSALKACRVGSLGRVSPPSSSQRAGSLLVVLALADPGPLSSARGDTFCGSARVQEATSGLPALPTRRLVVCLPRWGGREAPRKASRPPPALPEHNQVISITQNIPKVPLPRRPQCCPLFTL